MCAFYNEIKKSNSSVDSYMSSLLQSQVRIPSTPSTLFPFRVNCSIFVIALKKDEEKQNEAGFGFGPLKKSNRTRPLLTLSSFQTGPFANSISFIFFLLNQLCTKLTSVGFKIRSFDRKRV